jgi:hypothetical protein
VKPLGTQERTILSGARARYLAGVLVSGALVLATTGSEGALPGAATLVGPAGVVSGTSLTFTWQAGSDATFYYVQVNDATASPRLTLRYPAAMACPGGSATGSITVSTGFAAGPGTWRAAPPGGPGTVPSRAGCVRGGRGGFTEHP